MDFQLIAVLLYAVSAVLSAAVPACEDVEIYIFKRQMNSNSTCTTYGVDYQDGGNYFINTNSNRAFTFVSGFQGCNNATAQLSLVNEDTGDQYDCGSVPTVPNNAPQTATCQVQKSQLTSGTYLIITIGNNGVGNPFADERQFMIEAVPQQTITEYPTATATTPVVVTNCKSQRHDIPYISHAYRSPATIYVTHTLIVPNTLTISAHPTTQTTTVLPLVTTTQSETLTQTLATTTSENPTTTITVGPTCRIPKRPCTYTSQSAQITQSLGIHARALQQPYGDRHGIHKRAPDQRTTTVTASSNNTDVVTATLTFTSTASPQTIGGGVIVSTVTAPGYGYGYGYIHTQTAIQTVYATAYVTTTVVGRVSTQTVTDVPSAFAAQCTSKGGYIG
jgi:hypothetical protein